MNYCVVAFGVILLISCTTWFVDGRKHYVGPKVDVYAMLEGKVTGMDPSPPEPGTAEKVNGGPAPDSDVMHVQVK
jgi:hypothetical protein